MGNKGINEENRAKLWLVFTMLVFGTIGTLTRFIQMPSGVIAMGRAFFGFITIVIILALRKIKPDYEAIRRNAGWLCLSSVFLCMNWVCQFEAYKYTTIATSTLCYYTQPIFYILIGSAVLKEKLSGRKLACVGVAFVGMVLVSGVLQTGFHFSELKGAIFGITGGFFYAMVVLINKYIKNISPVNTTIVQLALVSIIMLPYSWLTGGLAETKVTVTGLICLIVLGAIHTGISYIIYFDSVNKLSTQTVGILSYIDPVEAVMLSAFFLHEPVTASTIAGAVLILGSTAVSELGRDEH